MGSWAVSRVGAAPGDWAGPIRFIIPLRTLTIPLPLHRYYVP